MLANYSRSTAAAAEPPASRRKPMFHSQYVRSSSSQTDAHPLVWANPNLDDLCIATSPGSRSVGTDPLVRAPSIRAGMRTLLLSLVLVLTSGCAGEPYRPVLPADHPANSAAEQAPEPAPSTTLANSTVESVAPPSGATAVGASGTSEHQGHKGHQMHGHAGHQM